MARYGTGIGEPSKRGALFECAEHPADAGLVAVSPARPGLLVVAYFLGENYDWTIRDPAAFEALCELVERDTIDAVELRRYHWLFAPFYCLGCEASYCTQHWKPEEVHGPGGYNHTRGTCPHGHLQKIHGWSTDSAALDDDD